MDKKVVGRYSRVIFCAALVGQLFATQAIAQVNDDPVLIRLNQIELKPEMVNQFRAVHRDIWTPSARTAGVAWRLINRTMVGNTMQVVVASPIDNMAALANPTSTNIPASLSQMAGDMTLATMTSRRSFVVTSRPDMSMTAVPNTGLSTLIHFQLKAGKNLDFKNFMVESALPAMEASGVVGAQMFETVMGGPSGEFWLTVPQAGFTALDGPGPFSSLTPAQGAQMSAMGSELFESWETSITQTDQELSYGLPGLQP